jgi:hypothetical protein
MVTNGAVRAPMRAIPAMRTGSHQRRRLSAAKI